MFTALFSAGEPTTPSLNGLAAASDRGYNGGTMFSISKFLGHDEKFYDLWRRARSKPIAAFIT